MNSMTDLSETIRRRWVTDPIFSDRETVPVSLARNEILDLLDVIDSLRLQIATAMAVPAELVKGENKC